MLWSPAALCLPTAHPAAPTTYLLRPSSLALVRTVGIPGSVPVAFSSLHWSPSSLQVPFVSVGGDIGVRTVRHRDTSTLSGEYVIEDVKGDGTCYFRRLIFLRNRNVVQSEARLLAPMPLPGMWGRWVS